MAQIGVGRRYTIAVALAVAIGGLPAAQRGPNTPAIQQDAAAYARRTASPDSPAFVDAFFQRLTELLQPSLGRRGAPVDQPPPPARGTPLVNPTLRNDARFRASLQDMLARTQSWYGQDTAPGEFAAAVALLGADCSGTLIAPNVVLTASHCWCHGMSPTGVLFGESRQTGTAVTVDLTRSRRMTTSCADGDLQRGDAALLFLTAASAIAPQHLADPAWVTQPGSGLAVGFGLQQTGATGRKQKVNLAVVSKNCDGSNDAAKYGCAPSDELVAGGPRGVCHGDSGGPLLVQDPATNKDYLAALTSRLVKNGACGDGAVFVRLTGKILTWVQQQGVSPHVGI
jgi:hypothetical protein